MVGGQPFLGKPLPQAWRCGFFRSRALSKLGVVSFKCRVQGEASVLADNAGLTAAESPGNRRGF
jgi:hypothetical protein